MAAILIVDDDKNILIFLRAALAPMGHELTLVNGGAEALQSMEEKQFDLIISDLQMPQVDGLRVLKTGKKKNPNAEVLILTAYGSIKTAVKAMKAGAYEYLSKPVDIDELRLKVSSALTHQKMKLQIEQQQQEIREYHEMIQRDLKLAEQVQGSLVPNPFENEYIDVRIKYLPMIGVGGDYADIYSNGENICYLTLVDVTGHGITAALLVNRVCSELRQLTREDLEPREILYHLNHFIYDTFYRTGMFLTMFTCAIDFQRKSCCYAGAAHPAAILWKKKEKQFIQLASQNTIIGFEKMDIGQFIQEQVSLNSGDRLFLYTDGLIEIGKSHQSPDHLIQILRQHIELPANALLEAVPDENTKLKSKDDIFLMIADMK